MALAFTPFEYENRKCVNCGNYFVAQNNRSRVCKKNCRRSAASDGIQFVGVDGEGLGSDPSRYVLFGIGDRSIENIDGLQWKEIFSFIYGEFERRGRGVAFVGFFLGYDFAQVLKTLPEDRARMLLTIEGKKRRAHRVKGREPHPVECDGWQFDILGSKRLRLRPKNCRCQFASCRCPKAPWAFVCDVGGFWQTSFLNVVDPAGWGDHPVCTDEEFATLRIGKERRESAILDDEMRNYMHLEIRVLERAMSVLADGFRDANVRLNERQWFGPGQAAAKWMRGRVTRRSELEKAVPEWYRTAAQKSYYGGWFEVFCHGIVRRKVWEYDINSAYPSIIATLPCLEHGNYTEGLGEFRGRSDGYCLVYARVYSPTADEPVAEKRRNIGAMLHRDADGSIYRPDVTEGWFWLEELYAAERAGIVGTVDYREWVNYEPCECPPPFRAIAELYEDRLRVGKNSPQGKGAKLLYNSCYGKFAQSIGTPQFGNAIYASLITKGCRSQVLDAIATHPEGTSSVCMVATDAVFFLSPHPGLPISSRLGEWDCTERTGLTIFKPGVYWDDETRRQIREGSKPKFKARGINAVQFAEQISRVDEWFNAWDSGDSKQWPDVQFESGFSMVTPLQALMRNKWELAGKNQPKTLFHTSNPFRKREGLWWDPEWKVWRSGYRSMPRDARNMLLTESVTSCGYSKRFGSEDPFSDESREAFGVTEDGLMVDGFRALLNNRE